MRLFYYTATNSLAFFSWDSSQQILTKPCLISLIFLSGLSEICKIDDIQWHFYELVTKFYLWAGNWPYSQRGCEYSQNPLSAQTSQASFENSTHLWNFFHGKNVPKECCIMPLIGFSDCFIATPEFKIFSAKSIMMVKVIIVSKIFQIFS